VGRRRKSPKNKEALEAVHHWLRCELRGRGQKPRPGTPGCANSIKVLFMLFDRWYREKLGNDSPITHTTFMWALKALKYQKTLITSYRGKRVPVVMLRCYVVAKFTTYDMGPKARPKGPTKAQRERVLRLKAVRMSQDTEEVWREFRELVEQYVK
jgi:hypothetical protein